jgi:hypothetical protein
MSSSYYVIIMPQQGNVPELMSDRAGMALTFDTKNDAQEKIVEYWRTIKGTSALRMTVVELED